MKDIELLAKMDRVRASPRILALALAICLLIVAYQTWILATDYVRPSLRWIVSIQSLPPWERTALIIEDDEFAGHIGFLQENTPAEALLILPPKTLHNSYEHIGFMQYMLFPRDIHNCGHDESPEECVRRMGENIYILGLDYFPPRDAALESKMFLRYQDDLGVFVPK